MSKNKRNKRHPIISPHFGDNTEIGGFAEENGIFTFKDSKGNKIIPTHIDVGDGYMRQSGKIKVASQISTQKEQINLNPFSNIAGFDWLFVIDTNSKEYNGLKISISCSAFFKIQLDNPLTIKDEIEQTWTVSLSFLDSFIFINPKINPELIGWRELINRILKDPLYKDSFKVGIVVDSELGDLTAFNRQQKPLIGEHLLPNNFELIYASADVGKDAPNNKVITICDKTANNVWDYFLKHPEILDNLENLNNMFIDGSTIIRFNIVNKLSGFDVKNGEPIS